MVCKIFLGKNVGDAWGGIRPSHSYLGCQRIGVEAIAGANGLVCVFATIPRCDKVKGARYPPVAGLRYLELTSHGGVAVKGVAPREVENDGDSSRSVS